MSASQIKGQKRGRAGHRARIALVFGLLAAALAALFLWNLNVGNVHIGAHEMLRVLSGRGQDADSVNIVWRIRLPRLLMAAMLGGALALSGFFLQTFFDNPIAGPFILGISSGAKMVVALVMIYVLGHLGHISSYTLVAAAFVGAMIATGFILLVSRAVHNMAALLVAGIMISYICSAVTDFVVTFAADADIINLHGWSLGSFSGMSWGGVGIAAALIGAALLASLALAKPMRAYQMGEGYARSVGVNIRLFRAALIVLSSVLSATVTAFAGPISFVGIAVPFLLRAALGTAHPLAMIPGSFLGGAAFCLLCDLLARTAFAPTELNISTVTALFGAPVVIGMLIGSYRARSARG